MASAYNLDLDPKTDAEYDAAIDIMFVRLEKLHAEIAEIDSRSDVLREERKRSWTHFEEVMARLEAS